MGGRGLSIEMIPSRKSPSVAEGILSVAAWLAIGILTIFWTLLIGLVYLAHRWLDPQRRIIHRMAGLWGRGLVAMAPGCRVRLFGEGNIPVGRPVIFMANHQSYADIPVLYFLNGQQFKWMADTALFQIPFFGWAMRMAGYVPVRRGDARSGLRSLEEAKGWLKRGIPIFVFPEGTRSHTGALGRFQTGGFRLAVTTQTPIVPVVLIGTRRLLPRGGWVFRLGARPQIHLLPPIAPPSSDPRQVRPLARKVRAEMRSVYRRRLKDFR
ncbi:MAG: 1-acyl-sn-glycerol-3-phosphate acyltransferase [Candidatus Omnitrophica bacterium]|nr:1-acyl-sn-glycerol-3-phosphate acyltransferase [Candidatus Omnitrophota bacterium]